YNSYLTLFPNNLDAPVIIDSIMTIYKNYPSRTRNDGLAENLIIDEMKRIVNTYHSNSEWYKVNKNTLSDNAISIVVVKDAFEFLEPRYFNNFVRSKRYDDYLTYRDLIKNYVDFEEFSDSISVAKKFEMQLNVVNLSQEIAESNEDPHDYFVAINNIIEFDSLYGNHDHIFQFREMKYSDYEQIYTLLQDTVKVASYIDSELEIALDKNGLDSLYTQASKEYQDFLTNAENIGKTEDQILARIVYQRAEMNYSQNRLDAAYTDFSQLLSFVKDDTLATDDNIQKIALSRLAEISQGRGDFSVAENYYREAAKYASDNDREDLRNNMLASIQFKADTFVDSSDYITAAVEFLRLSEELFADDLQKSLGFKAKAIENYKSAGENQKAIDLLLEIASHKEEKMEVLAAFLSAWTITDSLNDFSQSEMLRRMFIEKYPNSNEAYQLRVQIIDLYENDPYNDKMKAAEMYLALYEDADQIDIGDVSRASIFLKAISIYQEAEMSDKLVDLMLEFEKLYPDHEMANDFLTFVASIYNEREETEKFEDLARKIYRKDPSIDLLSAIAVDNLKALKREVDDLFEAEHYEQMFVKMEEFNNATSSYKDDGLTLPLDAIYDSFNYYRDYINYYKKFDGVIAKITDEFLNASPGELLRVNELTKWKEHLSAGKRRITKLMEKCVTTKKELIALIQEGNEYNLSVEKRTEALYLAGKVYEYGSEVVKIQILKFVETSKQLNNEALAANPIEQTRFKNRFIRESHKISSQFKLESVKVYNSMLVTFSDDKDYSDQYTELAKQRLVDWGVRTPKIYVNKYTDLLWKFSNSTVANLDSIDTWENVQIEPEVTLLDSAAVIILSPAENNLVKYNFNIEYLPEVLSIQYVSELPATIYL
ncbi:MAG: hypothetical protein KAS49_04880, partial [Candidatus Cloacimonetes bacterium]|nr:hypothetical protein [Candidatus Cloacimonadota bacterium]